MGSATIYGGVNGDSYHY